MKLIIIASALTLFLVSNMHSQDLPHRMTKKEAELWKTYEPPSNPLFSDPPPTPVRGMAEWEELQGVIITWRSFYKMRIKG